MSITDIKRDYGDAVTIVRILTTSTVAQASTTGYLLAQEANIEAINNGPFSWLLSDSVLVACSDGSFFATISTDFESLIPYVFSTTVIGAPVVVGDFAVFASTSGNIEDLGYLPSDASKTRVVMANGATLANHIAVFADTTGTVKEPDAPVTLEENLAVTGTVVASGAITSTTGNITSGSSGDAGTFIAFPATAANGTLILAAGNAGGAFNTTITSGTIGQSTVYTVPDIGASTGGVVVSTAAVRMKSVAGAAAAGGNAAQSFTDAFCTSGSNVIGNWNTQANPASVLKIVPSNGSFVVTSDADAGVGTFNYVIMK